MHSRQVLANFTRFVNPSPRQCLQALQACANIPSVTGTLTVMHKMKDQDIKLYTKHYTYALNACKRIGNNHVLLEIFDEIQPEYRTCVQYTIAACVLKGDRLYELLQEALGRYRREEVMLDERFFATILSRIDTMDQLIYILEFITSEKIDMSSDCYSAAISTCFKLDQRPYGYSLMKHMKYQGFSPDHKTVKLLLYDCRHKGDLRAGIDLYEWSKQTGLKLDPQGLKIILDLFKTGTLSDQNEDYVDIIKEVFFQLENYSRPGSEGIVHSKAAFNAAVLALCRIEAAEEAMNLIRQMVSRHWVVPRSVCKAIIGVISKDVSPNAPKLMKEVVSMNLFAKSELSESNDMEVPEVTPLLSRVSLKLNKACELASKAVSKTTSKQCKTAKENNETTTKRQHQ